MSVEPVLVDWYGRAHPPAPEVGSATSGQIVLAQIRKMSQGKQACMQCCSIVLASAPGCIPALTYVSDGLKCKMRQNLSSPSCFCSLCLLQQQLWNYNTKGVVFLFLNSEALFNILDTSALVDIGFTNLSSSLLLFFISLVVSYKEHKTLILNQLLFVLLEPYI